MKPHLHKWIVKIFYYHIILNQTFRKTNLKFHFQSFKNQSRAISIYEFKHRDLYEPAENMFAIKIYVLTLYHRRTIIFYFHITLEYFFALHAKNENALNVKNAIPEVISRWKLTP